MCRILVTDNLSALVETVGEKRFISALKTLSNGGNVDACGFAILKKSGAIKWIRLPAPCHLVAHHLNANPDLFEDLVKDATYAMFHARKATGGEPLVNVNNHPFCDPGTRTCLIHNGSVKKTVYGGIDDEAEKILINRLHDPDTDSALLLAYLAVFLDKKPSATLIEAAEAAFYNFQGKASVAVIRAPTNEMLYTKNEKADIYIYSLKDEVTILATASDTIRRMVPGIYYGGELKAKQKMDPKHYYTLSKITIYWRDGLLRTRRFSSLIDPGSSSYSYSYSYYDSRWKV